MHKLKFPITSEDLFAGCSYTRGGYCAVCESSLRKSDFVCINSGSIDGSQHFMSIHSHFESSKIYKSLSIIDINSSQIDVYLCSIDCLRSYFNKMCDDLEKKTDPIKFRDKTINKLLKDDE